MTTRTYRVHDLDGGFYTLTEITHAPIPAPGRTTRDGLIHRAPEYVVTGGGLIPLPATRVERGHYRTVNDLELYSDDPNAP